jgi:hypothetical protein
VQPSIPIGASCETSVDRVTSTEGGLLDEKDMVNSAYSIGTPFVTHGFFDTPFVTHGFFDTPFVVCLHERHE